jgi:hypothetical protein
LVLKVLFLQKFASLSVRWIPSFISRGCLARQLPGGLPMGNLVAHQHAAPPTGECCGLANGVGARSGNPTGTPQPPPLTLRPATAPRISRFSPASPPSGGGHPPDLNAGHTSPSAAAEAGEWSGCFPLWRPHPPRPRCAQAHRPRGQHGGRRLPPRSARWLGLSGATPFSYLLSSSPLSIPQFALRRHSFFVPALPFGMCLARVCRRCSGDPLLLRRPSSGDALASRWPCSFLGHRDDSKKGQGFICKTTTFCPI